MCERPDHDPRPRAPTRLLRVRALGLRGCGRVVVDLDGSGRVRIRRGRGDEVSVRGQGCPRFLSAGEVLLSGARGRLEVRGLSLEIEFAGGRADVRVDGTFEAAPVAVPAPLRRPHAA
jgi:hypothetical protein